MKKLRLFALGLMGASTLFMTSCADDDEDEAVGPNLSVTEENHGVADGSVTVNPGDSVRFEWDARSGDADLDMFTIRVGGLDQDDWETEDGNSLPYDIASGDRGSYQDAVEFAADTQEGSTDYVFIVEDADGLRATRTVTVTVEGETTELDGPTPFTWERQGSNDGTGLAMFGLEWTENSSRGGSEVMAIIATDAASTTMVQLDPADWNNITTVEGIAAEIAAAIDGGNTITEYMGVSAEQDDTYDDVLAVSHNDNYYLIHITNGTVDVDQVQGATVTITGEYKAEP